MGLSLGKFSPFNEAQENINPNSSGGGGGFLHHAKQNLKKKKCPCSHNNKTALITQISLFDTALVRPNTYSCFNSKFTNTIKEYFTPILLELTKSITTCIN